MDTLAPISDAIAVAHFLPAFATTALSLPDAFATSATKRSHHNAQQKIGYIQADHSAFNKKSLPS